METKSTLKITVGGQNYTIVAAGRTNEAKAAASELDKKVSRILKSNPSCTYTQAVVLAALDFADTSRQAIDEVEKLRSEIRAYLEDSAKAKTERDKALRELERLKAKVNKAQRDETTGNLWSSTEF